MDGHPDRWNTLEVETMTDAPHLLYTELRKSPCTWFGEVCSCCCLPLLPQPAYNILATTYKDFFSAL